MAAVKYLLYLTLLIVFVAVVLIFCWRNEAAVSIDFVLFQGPSLGVGVWIVASFLFGSVLGWFAALPQWLGLKLVNKQRTKQLESKQKELVRLKGDMGNR